MIEYAEPSDIAAIKDCPTMNLCTRIINFYKREPKRLKAIKLDTEHWRMFIDDVRRLEDMMGVSESYPIDAINGVPIDGTDVVIKKASVLTTQPISYEFYPANIINDPTLLNVTATC